jgi:hypothetical protein
MNPPSTPLLLSFRAALAAADREAPADVLAVTAMALALDAVGCLHDISPEERQKLTSLARRALLAGDHDEDGLIARELAQAGLAVLENRPPVSAPADLTHPSALRLHDLWAGRLDGISSGSCAAHVRACAACRRDLQLIAAPSTDLPLPLHLEKEAPRVRLAAAEAPAVRPPEQGVLLTELPEDGVEIVLFSDVDRRRIAVYSRAPGPIRLTGPALTTEVMLPGYWLGTAAREAAELEATLHLPQGMRAIRLPLP